MKKIGRIGMKNNIRILSFVFIIGAILAACSSVPQEKLASTKTQTLQVTETITCTEVTSTLIPTIPVTPSPDILEKCPTPVPLNIKEGGLPGKLDVTDQKTEYLLDLKNGSKIQLPAHSDYILKSAEGKVVILSEENAGIHTITIRVYDDYLHLLKSFTFTNEKEISLSSIDWIKDEIVLYELPPCVAGFCDYGGTLLLPAFFFNIVTGQMEPINQEDYPDIDQTAWDWGHRSLALTFAPDRSLMLYPRLERENQNQILWDLQSHKQIAEIDCGGQCVYMPHWSANGQYSVLSKVLGGIILVDRNGKIQELTILDDAIPNLGEIDAYSISPDGNKLAMWAGSGNTVSNRELYLYDISNKQLIKYCKKPNSDMFLTPEWSPDSRYFAVNTLDTNAPAKQGGNNQIVLIDTENDVEYQVGTNDEMMLGWIN
jgi:WD40 repeat protein